MVGYIRQLTDDESDGEEENGEDSQDDEDRVVQLQGDVIHPWL